MAEMAIPKDTPEREALIQKAVNEVIALNPHVGAPPAPYTDEEYAELLAEWDTYNEEINKYLDERPDIPDYYASDAVNDDRGE